MLMTIYLNQQAIQTDISSSLFHLHAQLSLPSQGCVFSLYGQVVPRSEWQHTKLNSGMIFPFPSDSRRLNRMLKIADKTFQSRLFTGTGKFSNRHVMGEAFGRIRFRVGDHGDKAD